MKIAYLVMCGSHNYGFRKIIDNASRLREALFIFRLTSLTEILVDSLMLINENDIPHDFSGE